MALVAAGEQLTAGELKRFLKDKLAPYEQPRRIEFRDELPKTFIGKHSRLELVTEEIRRQNQGLPPLGDGDDEADERRATVGS